MTPYPLCICTHGSIIAFCVMSALHLGITPPSGKSFSKEESQAKRLCLVYFSIFMVVSLPICCVSSEELGFYTEGFQLCLLFPAALCFSLNISKEVFFSPGAPLCLAQPIIRGWCSKVGQTQVYTTDFIFCVCWMDFWTVLSNGDAVMLAGL